MPGYDGTGPRGEGPMTGGGFGYCTGGFWPRFGRTRGFGRGGGLGRGLGRGRGYGLGWRNRAYYGPASVEPAPTREEEANWLKGAISDLQRELEAMQNRLSELEE